MTLKEVNYTASVISVFAAVGLVLMLFFSKDNHYIASNLFFVLLLIAFVLSLPYFILKFFFYVNSHNENEELKLRELPKDQDDIEKTH